MNVRIAARLRCCALALVSVAAAQARAQSNAPRPATAPSGLELSVGAGPLAVPGYVGGSSVRLIPILQLTGTVGPDFEFDTLNGLRYTLLRIDGFSAGPFGRYRAGQPATDFPMRLRGLGSIGETIEIGGFAAWELGPFRLDTIVVQDPARVHGGAMVESHASLTIPFGDVRLRQGIEFGPFIELGNRAYLGRYLGVNARQSAATGLPVYSPRAGLDRVGVQTDVAFRLADRWAIHGVAQWGRLVDSAADSPIVRQGGSRDQFYAGAFLVYTPWGPAASTAAP